MVTLTVSTNLFVVLASHGAHLGGSVLPDVLQILDLGVVVVANSLHLGRAVFSDPVGLKNVLNVTLKARKIILSKDILNVLNTPIV